MSKKFLSVMLSMMLMLTVVMVTGCGGSSQDSKAEDSQTQVDETGDAEEIEAVDEAKDVQEEGTDEVKSGIDGGETVYPFTFTDSLGNEITVEEEPKSVISLSPANTEILFAVGAGERVIGRTDYCSYPEEASEVESIGTYTSPNTELIISMEPDVVFASDYVDDSIRKQVEDAGAKVVVFSAGSVEGVQELILQAGQILNLNENAEELVDSMNAELKEIQESVASKESKSVFVDIGSFYSAGPGALIDDMLNKIGVENIAADTGETWPQFSVESIIEKNPDVYISLFATPEELKNTSGLNELKCMEDDAIVYFYEFSNEADMIQRAGPRVVEGIKVLAEKIYTD